MCFILGSGLLEFGEFCQLAAKFLVEEDEEGLKKELKEAFRIYDKEGIFRRSVILKAKLKYCNRALHQITQWIIVLYY